MYVCYDWSLYKIKNTNTSKKEGGDHGAYYCPCFRPWLSISQSQRFELFGAAFKQHNPICLFVQAANKAFLSFYGRMPSG